MRLDGRTFDKIRDTKIIPDVSRYAEGSCLIEMGHTKVMCTASLEGQVPKWLAGSNKGWVTAEYGMLPRSTHTRMKRDNIANGGRTQEISRLIGRSLRAIIDMEALGEKSIQVDCDVLQADGGTRTAAITGGFVALGLAIGKMMKLGLLGKNPIRDYVAAVSVGLADVGAILDLNYEEDSSIQTDMNIVMTASGNFVEIQGTAEKHPFSPAQLSDMSDLARRGCGELFRIQHEILGKYFPLKLG